MLNVPQINGAVTSTREALSQKPFACITWTIITVSENINNNSTCLSTAKKIFEYTAHRWSLKYWCSFFSVAKPQSTVRTSCAICCMLSRWRHHHCQYGLVVQVRKWSYHQSTSLLWRAHTSTCRDVWLLPRHQRTSIHSFFFVGGKTTNSLVVGLQ